MDLATAEAWLKGGIAMLALEPKLKNTTSERALVARLMLHLEPGVPSEVREAGYVLDAEYNRTGEGVVAKRADLNACRAELEQACGLPDGSLGRVAKEEAGSLLTPDLVLHKRTLPENLVAIEAKPSHRHWHSIAQDVAKLLALRAMGYQWPFLVIFEGALRDSAPHLVTTALEGARIVSAFRRRA